MVTVVGQNPAAKLRCTCSNCGAILEYTKAEIKEHHGTDYGGGPDGMKWIDCPQCSQKAVLERW